MSQRQEDSIESDHNDYAEVVANCDHLKSLKFSHALPYAFTEHSAIMLASVLNRTQNSLIAVQTSVLVVRAFVKLREMLATHKDLAKKLDEMEKKYDMQFKVVFEAIKELMRPPEPKRIKIGFRREGEK